VTVYICHASRGECDLQDRCFIAQVKPQHGEHVVHFTSDRKGDFCPHFLRMPTDQGTQP